MKLKAVFCALGSFVVMTALLVDGGSTGATGLPASAPNLISNGSFETPKVANPCPNGGATNPTPDICTYFAGSTGITDWAVGGNSIDMVRKPTEKPKTGAQSVDLSGDAPGSLTQVVKTQPGLRYTLSFYLHSYGADSTTTGPTTKLTAVYWDGKQAALVRSVTDAWKVHTVTVTADSATSSLEFADVTPDEGYNGPLLDSVALAPRQQT